MSTIICPLKKKFSTTLKENVQEFGVNIPVGHCLELTAAFFSFKNYASLKADGLLSLSHYRYPPEIDINGFFEQSKKLNISESVQKIIEKCLISLHEEEITYFPLLAQRLAENIKEHTSLENSSIGLIFSGSVLLNEEDWDGCAGLASSSVFVDGLWTDSSIGPAIQTLMLIHNNPVNGYYSINPDPILNIIEFLDPKLMRKLLKEMNVRSY